MKKREEIRKNKQKLNRNKTIMFIISLIVIFTSFILIFNEPITKFVMKFNHKPSISQLLKDQNKNEISNDDFNYEKTSKVDVVSALKTTLYDEKVPVLGAITIPDLHVNLPILRGVSDYAILMGAGTMKKDQQMGKGNYALTSHHMLDKEVLFGPIIDAKKDLSIFITDLDYVYEYKVVNTEYIKATDVHVIEDRDGKVELTLITCDDTGEGRYMVNADLTKKVAIDKADKEIVNSFYGEQNQYK